MDILARLGVTSEANSRSAKQGTNIVRLLDTRLGVPADVVAVSQDRRAEGGAVVASNTDHKQAR